MKIIIENNGKIRRRNLFRGNQDANVARATLTLTLTRFLLLYVYTPLLYHPLVIKGERRALFYVRFKRIESSRDVLASQFSAFYISLYIFCVHLRFRYCKS